MPLSWPRPFKPAQSVRGRRGRQAERLAEQELIRQGYEILERNVRYPVGELDLVAREGRTLCFVEVRSTSTPDHGGPFASVTDRKRRHLIRAARWYLQHEPLRLPDTRFDVVGIEWRTEGPPMIEVLRGAFTVDGR